MRTRIWRTVTNEFDVNAAGAFTRICCRFVITSWKID
jgi:hypothetical protein